MIFARLKERIIDMFMLMLGLFVTVLLTAAVGYFLLSLCGVLFGILPLLIAVLAIAARLAHKAIMLAGGTTLYAALAFHTLPLWALPVVGAGVVGWIAWEFSQGVAEGLAA
jgi:hypothetical protein